MNSSTKKLMVILGLTLLASFGLAMMIQLENLPRTPQQSNLEETLTTKTSGSSQHSHPQSEIPIDNQNIVFNVQDIAERWEIEGDGLDTTFTGDTISFSFYIIGQDSALATALKVRWDTSRSAITRVSGDTSITHDFTEDDTLDKGYTFVVSDTGRFCIWLKISHDSSYANTSSLLVRKLYLLAYGDTTNSVDSVVVTADTFPDNFIDNDTIPDDMQLLGVETTTLSGIVYYRSEEYNNTERPCRGVLVKSSWRNKTDYTDEDGYYSITIPIDREFTLKVKGEGDGGVIKIDWLGTKLDHMWRQQKLLYTSGGAKTKNITIDAAYDEEAWLLNSAHDCRRFCNSNFSWVPSSNPANIRYPYSGWSSYNPAGEVIRIYSNHVWGLEHREVICHEYGHYVDDRGGTIGVGPGPPEGEGHYRNDCSSPKFAFTEGWAEFFAGAVLYDYFDLDWSDNIYKELDRFYENGGDPYWTDDGPNSGEEGDDWTDGEQVEGAVAQFLWDLFDKKENDEDYNGGYDDDDITREVGDMWDAFEENPQRASTFHDEWDDVSGSQNIDELYDVVVHQTSSSARYPVRPPTNFNAGFDYDEDDMWVVLTWDSPSTPNNVGHFKIYRHQIKAPLGQSDFTNWTEGHIIKYKGENATSHNDYDIDGGKRYIYGIRSVDNDTSVVKMDTISIPSFAIVIGDLVVIDGNRNGAPFVPGTYAEIPWVLCCDEILEKTPTGIDIDVSTDGGSSYTNIASDLDPGEYGVVYSDDEEGINYYGYDGTYDEWTVPNTPTTGVKFRYCAHFQAGDSVIGYSKLNYAITNGTGTPLSTAYTGCKQVECSSKTGMVYTDASNNVRYTESDDGFEWDTTITVVQSGATPTVTVVNDTPVVVWKDTDIADQTLYRSVFPFTAATPIVPAYGSGIQILSEANVFSAEDSFYVGVFRAYGMTQLSNLALIGKRLDLEGCVSTDTLFKATGSPVLAVSEAPALVVDNEHNTYYAFVYDGKTAFIYDDGSSLDIDTITTTSVAWPSLDVTTGNVYLTYGTVVSGDTVILRKWRYTDDTIWRGTDTLYKGPVTHLSTAGGVFTSFTEPDEDMKLLTFDPLAGSAGTEDLADSIINPHVALSRLSGPELAFEWTERVGANYYVMSERSDADAYLPHLYLEAGTTITPFTDHRDRTYDYGEIEVDIGTDSLVYEIEDLDTSLDYKLRLEFYFESETTDSTDYIITAAGETDTVTVHEETLTTHTMEIDSLGTDLTVKITGDDVGLTRLVFYEDNTGGGGTSSWSEVKDPDSEKRLPFMFSLESVIPTPFTKTAQIRFAMPVTQHVTLKVYDVTGREVRTLVNGPVEAGVHTLEWNGKDNLSRSVSAGVYFVRMATEGYQASRKTVLLK